MEGHFPGGRPLRDLRAKPGQVEHAIDPGEDMVVGNQIAERATHEELKLSSLPPPQHPDPPPCLPELRESVQQGEGNRFFNGPTRQRCQVALRIFETAARMPSWVSEMTSLTPRRPRRASLRRKAVQKGSASEGPMSMPSTSRRESVRFSV